MLNAQNLILELALQIDDPAGIEGINLAATILDIFSDRPSEECVAIRESLVQWAKQWPKNTETPPETLRSPICTK